MDLFLSWVLHPCVKIDACLTNKLKVHVHIDIDIAGKQDQDQ